MVTQGDVDGFHALVKRQLDAGADKLRVHLNGSCAAKNHEAELHGRVQEPSRRMQQAIGDFAKDVQAGALVRPEVDLRGKLYKPEDVARLAQNDPQSTILVDANCSYYGKKLVDVLKDLSAELRIAKLPQAMIAKREVGIFLTRRSGWCSRRSLMSL
jgi:hypothetical protein